MSTGPHEPFDADAAAEFRPSGSARVLVRDEGTTAAVRRSEERARLRRRRTARRGRRRRRALAGMLAVAVVGVAVLVALSGTQTGAHARRKHHRVARAATTHARPSAFAVGLETLRLVEPGKTIQLPNGAVVPRTLVAHIRYPALGAPGGADVPEAAPARLAGPFPLVVFGHGFAVTPGLYARLLDSWARAGYIVAAPLFPLENADAPGGPTEADLINQPDDVRFLISRLLAASGASSGLLSGLVNPAEVAVAGQSDGGDTALAVGYDTRFRDPLVKAVIVLSGAELPGLEGFQFAPGGPPLLATQGTADTVNPPGETEAFFAAARRPKYLLRIWGAGHLPPYSDQQPQLGIVERVTRAFLAAYLEKAPGAERELVAAGNVPQTATLLAEP